MIKILVHIISHLGKIIHDKFDEEIGHKLLTTIHVYSNTKDLDFSSIRYWKVMEDLKDYILNNS